jgi:hypothetical protein
LHLRPFAASDEREEQRGRRKRFPEKLIEQAYWNFEIMAEAKSKVSGDSGKCPECSIRWTSWRG